jgi:hypothetical protein
MKTNVIRSSSEWPKGQTGNNSLASVNLWRATTPWHKVRHYGIRLPLAVLLALAVVIATVWVVDAYETPQALQALIWTAGFVFLALAVESTKPNISALLATGLALPVLAVLSNRVATEFAIIAAVLVSAWIIHALLRR